MNGEMRQRFLLAPDSFKGTFDATEVAAAMARGVRTAGAEPDECPLADGGEGTLAALLAAAGGRRIEADAHDPLGRPIRAEFGMLADDATAVVEVAAASGLPLLAPRERDPERADTRGTGELILAATKSGAQTVLVGAGGSATVDGGRGAIEAIRAGGGLGKTQLVVLCDVEVPFEEAAEVFAPQKGAGGGAVARLEAQLDEFATTLPRDPRGVPMSGCAGGLSGGLMAAFDAELRPGAEYVLAQAGFAGRVGRADAVLTGEGQIDEQSVRGKLVGTLAATCARVERPLYAIVGRDALGPEAARAAGLAGVTEASTLEEIAAAAARLARGEKP